MGTNMLTLLAQASLPAFHVQLARRLGAGGYGLYSWSMAFVDMFSVITMFGMDLAVSRQVSVAHAEGATDRAVAATGSALRLVLTSGILVALGITLAAPALAHWQHKPALVVPLRTLVLVPIAYHAASIFILATQAKMVMRYEFWTRGLFQPLALLGLTTLALQLGLGVRGACLAVAAGMSLAALLSAGFYSREWPLLPTLRRAWQGPFDPALLRAGLPVVVLGLVWGIQGRVDAFFLGHYRSSEDVGAYGACVLYVVSLGQVRSTFSPVINATLPPLIERGDTVGMNIFIQRQTRWVALLAMPLFVLFAGFGDGLLAVFGPAFIRGVPALGILAVGQLAGALSVPTFTLLLSNRARYSTFAGATCLVCQLVLLPILVPRYGLTGAALASATGMVISQVMQHGFSWTIMRVHGMSLGLAKVAAASAAGFAVGRSVFHWSAGPLLLRFLAGVGVAAGVYLLALVSLGLRDDERTIVRDGAARARAVLSGLLRRSP